MTVANEAVVICDLDGTILRVNSFPRWISHLIAGPLPGVHLRARAMLSSRVLWSLTRRKLRRIDHRHFLREVQIALDDVAGTDSDAVLRCMRSRLRRCVRDNVEFLLGEIEMGKTDAVLATAAAGEYASCFGRELGFRHVLTTPALLPSDKPINVGVRKLERVLEFLAERDWDHRPLVLLTDHVDDLPLIRHCGFVAWFGPDAQMDLAMRLAGDATFVACRQLDATTLSRTLDELSARAAEAASVARNVPEMISV